MDPVFHAGLRFALALLFVTAALHKLREPERFAASVRDYRVLPDAWAGAASRAFASTEAVLAVLLFATGSESLSMGSGPFSMGSGPWLRGAAVMAALLIATYSLAIAVNLARGRRSIDCGCLGPAMRQPLSAGLLVRNTVVVGAALGLLVPTTSRALGPIDVLAIAGGVACAALLFHGANQLLATGARLREESAARVHA